MCILLLLRCCTTDYPRTAESPRRRRSTPPLLVMQQIWSIHFLFLAFLNEAFLPSTCWGRQSCVPVDISPWSFTSAFKMVEAFIHSRKMNRNLE